MASDKKSITVSLEELEGIHKKLEGFMAELPEKERKAMALILARAASAKEDFKDDIDQHLLAVKGEPSIPTLPMLARAIDGISDFKKDVTGEAGIWAYKFWTYHHK